jgi:AcrR family transcriptional regulator
MSRTDWISAGFELIAEEGAATLRIDRLAARLQRTKGSFYHHFDDMPAYKQALLAAFEESHTTRFIEAVEGHVELTASEKLDHLLELVLASEPDAQLETQLRAWALQDADVLRAQERIDRIRLDYLTRLCRELVDDPREAGDLAQLLHVIVVGAWHVVPPLDVDQLRRVYRHALARVAERAGGRD